MTSFFERLKHRQMDRESLLCVGLDPDQGRLPSAVAGDADPIFSFNRAIIDATADLVCCYKPQIAHYAALGAERALEQTIDYIKARDIPVLLDAKRGDIGSTAEQYAEELFTRYGADAVTVNPYLGTDSLAPYLAWSDRGVFILCRTSNPGGADVQNLELAGGGQVFEHVARLAAERWNEAGNVGLVVGATRPDELARVRDITGAMPLLVPGIGAQGGDIRATLAAGEGGPLVLNSSRAILYAVEETGGDFAEAARCAAERTRDEITRHRVAANR